MVYKKEVSLIKPVVSFLKKNSFSNCVEELSFYDHRIDIYGFSKKVNQTVAVELKLTKWQKAIKQALVYQLCSDLVYIAMPFRNILKLNLIELEKYGIGLIVVKSKGECTAVLKAKKSEVIRDDYRSRYIKMLGSH
jgi:hypothetical protein